MLGLYIHIPFCSAICNYCNFNRGLLDDSLKRRYVRALEDEILRNATGEPADTIFFGGGTPSLLHAEELERLLSACRHSFAVPRDAEITLEANPETVTALTLAEYRAAGVNRVSFGVQSFRDEELARLGRLHSASRARDAYRAARDAGYTNVSLDLMLWLPQQALDHVMYSVRELIALGPDHASLYLLELYPNSPLKEEMARANWSLAPDDEAADMYLSALEALEDAGYQQYEISNVARPGRQSLHNLKYWTDGEWLGFGCGAHSTRRGTRWRNVASTEEYIARLAAKREVVVERRTLTSGQQLEEALFTGLRLNDGVSLSGLQRRYGVDVWSLYGDQLATAIEAGHAVRDQDTLRLTRSGMLVANEVLSIFVS